MIRPKGKSGHNSWLGRRVLRRSGRVSLVGWRIAVAFTIALLTQNVLTGLKRIAINPEWLEWAEAWRLLPISG